MATLYRVVVGYAHFATRPGRWNDYLTATTHLSNSLGSADRSNVQHVLIVDDDATVLNAFGLALKGYLLSLAREPFEALSMAEGASRLDLVITDFLMPSMTGDELVARVRARHPAVKALIVTGHGDILDGEAPDWWVNEAHLNKPFGVTALQRAVTDLIGPPTNTPGAPSGAPSETLTGTDGPRV